MLIAIPQGVWAEDYPITVAGVQVTSENAWNVLGDQETPTVVFTPADDTNPATLTLHSATIDMSDTDGYAVESSIANLTVRFEFENTIKVWTDKPYAFKYSGTGTGSLTFVSELDENYATLYGWLQVNGISEFGSVASGYTISNTFGEKPSDTNQEQLNAATDGWKFKAVTGQNNDYVDIQYCAYYDVWYGSMRFWSQCLTPASGGVISYDPTTHTLHLNNNSSEGSFSSKLSELIVEISGVNTNTSGFSYTGTDAGTILFRKNSNSEATEHTLFITNYDGAITGFSNVTIDESLNLINPTAVPEAWDNTIYNVLLSDITYYGLSIGYSDLNENNLSDLPENVTYDAASNTLKLTGATIGSQDFNQDITVSDYNGETLYIEISGVNTINGTIWGRDHKLNIVKASGALEETSLTVTNNTGHAVTAFSDVTLGSGLYLSGYSYNSEATPQYTALNVYYSSPSYQDVNGTLSNRVVFSDTEPEQEASIWIGGLQVMQDGKFPDMANISFASEGGVNTLTLEGVTIGDSQNKKDIVTSLDNLTILLKGENTLWGKIVSLNSSAALTFTSDNGGTITIQGNIPVSGFSGTPTVTNDDYVFIPGLGYYQVYKLEAPSIVSETGEEFYIGSDFYNPENGGFTGGTVSYTITYPGQDPIEGEYDYITDEGVEITGPCTITAQVSYGGKTSPVTTAKRFGFAEPLTITYNGTALELTSADLPALVPAVADGDNVTYEIAGVSEGTAVTFVEQKKYMVNGVGTAVLGISIGGDNTPYQVLNVVASLTVNVVPPAITFTGSNLWATYYSTDNLAVPEGLTAYVVSAVDEENGEVTATQIGYIPANNAVLLKRTDTATETYTAAAYTGTTGTVNNRLSGSTQETAVSSIANSPVYVLFNDKFKRATSGTIPARRAYLALGAAVAPSGAPRFMNISIGDGSVTAIKTVAVDDNSNDSWYTIDGLKLNGKPQRKGLYINKGKKMYINNNK